MHEQQMEGLDRRIFARFPVQFSLTINSAGSLNDQRGTTFDINAQGIGMEVDGQPEVNTAVDISVALPQSEDPFQACGKIIWSAPAGSSRCRVGVELEKIELMKMSRFMRARRDASIR